MSVTHTPGPWHFRDQPFRQHMKGCSVIIGPAHAARDFIDVGSGGGPEDVRAGDRANARLIAAAPELLEACETARVALTHGSGDSYTKAALKEVLSALAKAEGKDVSCS